MEHADPTGTTWYQADMSPDEFRKLGYRVINMIAEYYEALPQAPVFPLQNSSQIEELIREPLPQEGQDPDAILDDWEARVLPNVTHLGSPRYFGFVNGSGSMMAILAEALSASINQNVGAWKPGPAATEIERRTISWLAELIGYEPSCGGLFASGGTMANFTALLAALRNTAPYDMTAEGLYGQTQGNRFRLYMSDHEGHVSIKRCADLLNLGRDAVRLVPSREDFTMDVQALADMVDEDTRRGDVPFCVIGQAGSINVGAIDPLDAMGAICRERGIWFHVDGASGAVGAMLPEKRHLYRGMELADSVTLDPHKWLYIPYECGCVLVRDAEKLRRTFSMTAPYLRGTLPTRDKGLDYLEYGPQMSRGFLALKVWMTMKHYGVDGYRKLLGQNVSCAQHLHDLVRASSDFEVLHNPTLFVYSFRYAPASYRQQVESNPVLAEEIEEYLDLINQRIADEIQASGVAFVMTSSVRNRTVMRFSICSHRTTLADIELVFDLIQRVAREMDHGQAHEAQPRDDGPKQHQILQNSTRGKR
jgi:glutamate/tyrosine decarboxylase-like PLP-dependent enzyme